MYYYCCCCYYYYYYYIYVVAVYVGYVVADVGGLQVAALAHAS